MQIQGIQLTHFKNYNSENFTFDPKYNAIVGYNGMGKTNLLDAIYMSCMTKSNFTRQDRNLILSGEGFMRIAASIDNKKVVCKFVKGKKKIFEVNAKPYPKLADHIGRFPVVFIVPNDQNLLLDGSVERRKLLDNTISQIDRVYLRHLIKYNSLLYQRNAYLKLCLKSGNFSESMALTYTEQMQEACVQIYEKRSAFAREFELVFQNKYRTISKDQEQATCTYKSHMHDDTFIELAKASLEKDRILGRTSVGIHKDDLVFKMNNKAVKNFASQGQTKSFILSLKLAQYKIIAEEKSLQPVLLLDDLFDKLDHKRVSHLIELLEAEEVGQVFISDTDTDRVVNILEKMNVSYKKIVIKNGSYLNKSDEGEEE